MAGQEKQPKRASEPMSPWRVPEHRGPFERITTIEGVTIIDVHKKRPVQQPLRKK